jgi:hypothetical protein
LTGISGLLPPFRCPAGVKHCISLGLVGPAPLLRDGAIGPALVCVACPGDRLARSARRGPRLVTSVARLGSRLAFPASGRPLTPRRASVWSAHPGRLRLTDGPRGPRPGHFGAPARTPRALHRGPCSNCFVQFSLPVSPFAAAALAAPGGTGAHVRAHTSVIL